MENEAKVKKNKHFEASDEETDQRHILMPKLSGACRCFKAK